MKGWITKLGIFLLILMFLLSGIHKIYKWGCCEHKPLESMGFSRGTSQTIVLIVGFFEVSAVLLLAWGMFKDRCEYVQIALLGLIGFTILATAIYKVWYEFKRIPFLANLSVLGGLLIAYSVACE